MPSGIDPRQVSNSKALRFKGMNFR
jgi:hypothetical protein